LDLEEILAAEQGLVEDAPETPNVHGIKGGKKKHGGKKMKEEPEGIAYLDFETFMEVNLRVGRISSVDDHPNADKLYVVALDDGTESGRTICAGLKEHYSPEEMEGKLVVFVENLKPRPLRGITSEGMMLAADDGNGRVVLVTLDGDIAPGSQVR
jgi:methionyl-tRNA synthetase